MSANILPSGNCISHSWSASLSPPFLEVSAPQGVNTSLSKFSSFPVPILFLYLSVAGCEMHRHYRDDTAHQDPLLSGHDGLESAFCHKTGRCLTSAAPVTVIKVIKAPYSVKNLQSAHSSESE